MSQPFRSSAFAGWVPEFVAWNHRRSGIGGPPSTAQIAAYRGLFARDQIAVGNVAVFLHHAIGPGASPVSPDPWWDGALAALNAPDLDIDPWADGVLARRPLREGNGRCARALQCWYRLRREDAAFGAGAWTGPSAPRPAPMRPN